MKTFTFNSRIFRLGLVMGLLFAADMQQAAAQLYTTISAATTILNQGTTVNLPNSVYTNNGTYTDTTSPGAFNVTGGITFAGTGNTTLYNLNFLSSGASVFNSLVSVYNTATIAAGTSVNANNNLDIRYDIKKGANLVVNGVLTGNVQGLSAIGSVDTGGCPFFTSVLSTNITGPVMQYQWQSSPDSATWTNIPGATNPTYTAAIAHTTYYRAGLTTTNSSFSEFTAGKKELFTGIYPEPIRGNPIVCAGQTLLLSDTSTVGYWTSVNTGTATVGFTTGLVTGVTAGTATISYTLLPGCGVFTTLTVNPVPSPIGGTPVVCVGSTTLLTDGAGTWFSSNPGLATIGSSSGLVTGVVAGTPVITFTSGTTGCFVTQAVTVNPLPAPITGFNNVCYGLSTTLNDVTKPGTWTSSAPGVATIGSSSGIVNGVNPAGGTTLISYTLSTGCAATMQFTVNTLPTNYTLFPTGTVSYCPGTPAPDVYLASSAIGVNYQLYKTSVMVGSPLAGTGSLLDYGPQTAAGSYTVQATNATTGCTATMPGNPIININPVPPVDTLSASNGGSYCAGGPGADLFIIHSTSSIVYTLNQVGVGAVGISFGSTGSSADFGNYTPGIYTAFATNTFGCNIDMIGTITVTQDPLPPVDTVTGGGSYCAGGSGVHVGLSYAESGINYQLFKDGTAFGLPVAGANSGLDFGAMTLAGTYKVTATNAGTGCSTNMADSAVVSINPLPLVDTVTGGGNFCPGGTGVTVSLSGSETGVNYQLYDGPTPVDTAFAGTGFGFSFGLVTGVGTYTVIATNTTTSCTSSMFGSANVGIYPALTVDTLKSSASSYCAGDAGVDMKLTGSTIGVKYYLYNTSSIIDSLPGSGSVLDFGLKPLAGGYSVVATKLSTGCSSSMAGNPFITINALPAVYTVSVTNSGNICAGGPGVHIDLSFSDIDVNYQLWKGLSMVGGAVGGSNSPIDFGTFDTAGTYKVIATNSVTHCVSNMADSAVITVNPLPIAYAITGGGSYCAGGSGKHIGLAHSDTGITYQLYNGPSPTGIPVAGTGSVLDFGAQIVFGNYSIVATNNTTGCTNNMTGTTVITINPLPIVFNVTGGGDYCSGGSGSHIGLSGSSTGVKYQVFKSSLPVGAAVSGTGAVLDLGLETLAGSYTVVATTTVSGCVSNMNDSAVVIIDPLPDADTVTGGGSYCAGGSGVHIGLNTSDAGVNYNIYRAGVATGISVAGTGLMLDLGPQTTGGVYTVVAVNTATGCSRKMTDSATIVVNAAPLTYTVTGGGHYCAGGVGFPIYLSGSQKGVAYQLYAGTPAVGKPVAGTGAGLNFGLQTIGDTYTVIATNTTTGCTANMSGSGNIVVDPLPDTFAITGGGHYCAGGTGVLVGLTGSVAGINYQLYVGSTPVGLPVGGTGASLNFGFEKTGGTYSIIGTNLLTTCKNHMSDTVAVVVDPVVTPSVTITTSTGDDTACVGAATTFTAVPVNGGSAPMYQWSVNGLPAVSTNPYSYVAADKDVVAVTLTSDAACATTGTATRSLTMSVIPYQTPSADITITPGNNVCKGTTVTLSATAQFGGKTPAHTWLKNSIPVGSGTNYTYTPGVAGNGDVLIFALMSDYRCRISHTDTVFSNAIVMIVDSPQAPAFSISSRLGPVIGVGQVDTFTAAVTNGNAAILTYQWSVNNTPIDGANSPQYIDYNVFNGDVVSCNVTRTGACGGQSAEQTLKVIDLKNVGVQQVVAGNADISVLPNPNKGEFTVKGSLGSKDDQEVTLEITDMLGQVVYKGKVTANGGNLNERISLKSNIANGMYLLTLHSGSGNSVYHIVVEQ